MWSLIGLMVVAFCLSALPATACLCEGGGIAGCQAPVADVIVVATGFQRDNPEWSTSLCTAFNPGLR